ncbi:MAG: M48 family metallopeptidase [Chloroflexi bacterium]|nr:M48 family metallopeptidase [Chloroflexota bacterium]
MSINITRSDKRRKTVSARMVGGVLEIQAPAHMSDADLEPIIAKLQGRIDKRQQRRELDDGDLAKIAHDLNQRYFQGKLKWQSLQWSTQQDKRYGSCTPADQTIRISHRLAKLPRFVLEYVVMHELAHLLEANHGRNFWKLVGRYPLTERARGYLMALDLEAVTVEH